MDGQALSRRTVLTSALAMSLAACGGKGELSTGSAGLGSEARTFTKVAVGVIPVIDVAPLYLGVRKGFFSQRELDVVPVPAQTGAAIITSVLSGEYLVGFSNVVSLLIARSKGAPLVSIAGGASSTGSPQNDMNAVLVGKRSGLRKIKDLEGRKVAINARNNVGDVTIKNAVKKAGGNPAKVKFVEMPFSDMPTQLALGFVDAAWEGEPFRTQILAAGGRILFDNLTETYPYLQIAHYFTGEQAKQKNPQVMDSFVEAIDESLEYAKANPDKARAIMSTFMTIAPEVAAGMVLPNWEFSLNRESTTVIGEAARSFGALTKAPDVAGLLGV